MSTSVYKAVDRKLYRRRIDRNIGWVTEKEQMTLLRKSKVAIAGTGGMGGLIAATLLRSGIGELRICDCEKFDVSNFNRQFAARLATIGKSKARETAKELRRICDDTKLVVETKGITEATVRPFLAGCDLIYDEIEFFAIGARILLHQVAREFGIQIINCNSVGFGTRLFFFTPHSLTMEELLGFSYEEAKQLEQEARARSKKAQKKIIRSVMNGLVPELPDYGPGGRQAVYDRLMSGKAPIIGTNPPMATGVACNRGLLYLVRNSGVPRNILALSEMPAYLYFDAATWEAKLVKKRWWKHVST